MFSTLLTLALLASPAIRGVLAGQLAIATPTFTQCQKAQISWSEGTGPYNLIVVDSSDPCGDSLAELGDHNGNSMSWKVGLIAGKTVELSLEDSTGVEAWSGVITVAKSDDTSCLSPAQLSQISSSAGSSSSNSNSSKSNSTNPNVPEPKVPGSTLTITPTMTLQVPGYTPTASVSIAPVGGVGNAGANPLGLGNGAHTMRQASTPVMILGGLAAILVTSL